MRSGLKTLTSWWLAAMIGVCLAAGAAEASDKAKEKQKARQQQQLQCEEKCAQDSEEKVRACINSCPLPRRGNTEEYQACTRRCVSNVSTEACSERCEQASGGKKASAPRRYKKRNPNFPGPAAGE